VPERVATWLPRSLGDREAAIALGSNLGDREAMLKTARTEIAALPGTRLVGESVVEETAPLGRADQPAFLNQMLLIETAMEPRALLEALLAIEQRAGRVRGERWGPRTLDCDIVLFGSRKIDEPGLSVPHPELVNRDFWQRELQGLDVHYELG
jgi:2-amino-4-hydroxy-6-hydroxymethyldihydropteridine diphosphokinase